MARASAASKFPVLVSVGPRAVFSGVTGALVSRARSTFGVRASYFTASSVAACWACSQRLGDDDRDRLVVVDDDVVLQQLQDPVALAALLRAGEAAARSRA